MKPDARELGRSTYCPSLTDAAPHDAASQSGATVDDVVNRDLNTLAKGGRTNFFGFLLRLAARLPFLFIAGVCMALMRWGGLPRRWW
jgi:hypothetical protein